MSFHRLVMSAALAVGIASAAPLAAAREPLRDAVPSVAPVAVDAVDVEQVPVLGAGVPLNFSVFGTAGAVVTVRIDGARRVLELLEAEPGVYEGRYVIDGVDTIRPESRVTATLQKNGAVAYAVLEEPLLLAHGSVPWNVAAPTPSPPTPTRGTPVPAADAAATAMPIPLVVLPQPVAPVARAATAPAEPASCADCAVVESVRAVEAPPRGGVVGAIGGAIAGAILGKEIGEAHNRRVLAFLGALGGALAGRQIERQATRSTQYDVDLRLADGTLLKRRYEQAPPFAAGATIRLGTPAAGH